MLYKFPCAYWLLPAWPISFSDMLKSLISVCSCLFLLVVLSVFTLYLIFWSYAIRYICINAELMNQTSYYSPYFCNGLYLLLPLFPTDIPTPVLFWLVYFWLSTFLWLCTLDMSFVNGTLWDKYKTWCLMLAPGIHVAIL